MKVDPTTIFWLSLFATIGQGVASGAVHLAVPEPYLSYVTAWISFAVFCVMSFLTALNAFSSNKSGPLAPPPTIPEANAILSEAKKAADK